MKLKDFLTLKVGSGIILSGNVYNPLINYDWSTTTAKEYKTDGVELVINGGFDTDMYWTKGTGWTIVNGVAIRTGVTSNSFVGQTITLTAGTTYKFTLDVNSIVGSGAIYTPSTAQTILTFSTIGTKTAYFTPNATQPYIIGYYGTGTAELKIDNISIQKVIEEPNKRYLKDVGSTPTYNASMYFGRGAYFNGVDQGVTVPINATIQTALKRVNGVITINETSQALTNYVISGLGVHKDYYLFTRLLTTAEKESYTNTPELFYAMAQADSTCVLNMPMCETDGYARNMKSYILGSELVVNGDFGDGTTNGFQTFGNSTITNINNECVVTNILTTSLATNDVYSFSIGDSILISIDVYDTIATTHRVYNGSTYLYAGTSVANRWTTISAIITFTAPLNRIVFNKNDKTDCKIDNISAKPISNIYPITNYTSSVRDNAKNLQYGLQTCKFVRDGLGVIQSASDYLECDGGGYANTGWIPSVSEDWTIELIQNDKSTSLQTIGTGTSTPNVFIGRNGSYISSKIGNIDMAAITNLLINHIVVTFNAESKLTNFYVNNQLSSGGNIVTNTSWVNSFSLGVNTQKTFPSSAIFRTFKVHNKVLTQEEITKNYNSYVAAGLLDV